MPTIVKLPPRKRTRSKKVAFVLSLPADLPAKEVVAKAKEAGVKLRDKYVYVIRSNARARARRFKVGRPKASTDILVGRALGTETEFRRLALELGLGKAKALLKDTEQKVTALIAGT